MRIDAAVVSGAQPLIRLAVLVVALLLLSSVGRAELRRYEYSADAMGGVFSITLYSHNHSNAEAATAAAFTELRRLDRLLSNYRPDSQWSEVNRYAAQRPVKVSQDLFDLLSACLAYSHRSEGAFDITVGPLMKAWGFYDASGRFADEVAVQEALSYVGYAHIQLDTANRTVRFARAGLEIDPGGIGKGYAVDRMVEVLKQNGIERALLSAAGSSIYAMGTPPEQDGWRVSIRGPNKPDSHSDQLLLKNESLSTSGSSQKFFRIKGQVYGHILDPRTGYPAREASLVSVIAPHALDSEAWTKAFFVNGRHWSAQHIPAGFRVFFCADEAGRPLCGWLP